MRNAITLAVLLCGLLAGSTLCAQEAAPAAEAPAEKAPAKESADQDSPAESRDGPSPDVFIPTEEISEDFAVSFPVDI
jgi:hypothetical protein